MNKKNFNKKLMLAGWGVVVIAIVAVVVMTRSTVLAPLSAITTTAKTNVSSQSHVKVSTLAIDQKIKQNNNQKSVHAVSDALVEAWNLDKRNQFTNMNTREDETGKVHARYQQTYEGVPVWGRQVILHYNEMGDLNRITGEKTPELETKLAGIDLKNPKITAAQALQMAKEKVGDFVQVSSNQLHFYNEKADMVIYVDKKTKEAHQAYNVNYAVDTPEGGSPARPNLIIDAQSGSVLKQWNALASDFVGTGPGGNPKIGQHEFDPNSQLSYGIYGNLDVTPGYLSVDCTMTDHNGYVSSVHLKQGTFKYIPLVYPCFRNTYKPTNDGYSPTNDAHFYGSKTADMYADWTHVLPGFRHWWEYLPTFQPAHITNNNKGEISWRTVDRTLNAPAETWTITAIDGTTFSVVGSVSGKKADATVGVPYDNGIVQFTISSTEDPSSNPYVVGDKFLITYRATNLLLRASYGIRFENAFWDGSYVSFGDGDDEFYPFATAVDIVGHEISHAYTELNSNLTYAGESGGINEAYSDIAGEATENYWKGTNDWLIGYDAVKAKNKSLRYFADPRLDGYSITHITQYFDGLDVHLSSGIYNRAFYVLANSKIPATPLAPTPQNWDVKKAFGLFAYANKYYWFEDTDLWDGACDVEYSAKDLGYDPRGVAQAFESVGLQCGLYAEHADDDDTDDWGPIILDKDLDKMDDVWESKQKFHVDTSQYVAFNNGFTGADGKGTLSQLRMSSASSYPLDIFCCKTSYPDWKAETWTLTAIDPVPPAKVATQFRVVGSILGRDPDAFVGVPYDNGYIAFTIITPAPVSNTPTPVPSILPTETPIPSVLPTITPTNTPVGFVKGDKFTVRVVDTAPTTQRQQLSSGVGSGTISVSRVSTAVTQTWTFTAKAPKIKDDPATIFSVKGTSSDTALDKILLTNMGKSSDAIVGTPYDNGLIEATITVGDVPFKEGDTFTVVVVDEGGLDYDGDGYSNFQEYEAQSDPRNPNSIPITARIGESFESTTLPAGWTQPFGSDSTWFPKKGKASDLYYGLTTGKVEKGKIAQIEFSRNLFVESNKNGFPVGDTYDSTWFLFDVWLSNSDPFNVYVDGFLEKSLTGVSTGWQTIAIPMTRYKHNIIFEYNRKNSTGIAPGTTSQVWIDNIRYTDIEADSDNDGYADGVDTDDDGDGVLDVDELKQGTNPIVVDTDGDGFSDGVDAYPLDSSRIGIRGTVAVAHAGSALASADVDGDGYEDIVVGSPKDDPVNQTTGKIMKDAGTVQVYSGKNGQLLYRWLGENAGDNFGISVANAGDVDASDDGKDDIIIGATGYDSVVSGTRQSNAGAAYVYSGIGTFGVRLHKFEGEAAGDNFGVAVAGGNLGVHEDGDPDDVEDRHDTDLIVGANLADPLDGAGKQMKDAGRVYAYSGRDFTELHRWNGEAAGDAFGSTVATGNVDTLAVADIVVGAPKRDVVSGGTTLNKDAGTVYVYSGNNFGELHRFNGEAAGDAFGSSIAVGAIDAEAGSDIVIGAPMRDVGLLKDAGAIYAYSGVSYAPISALSKTGGAAGDAFGSAIALGAIDATDRNDVVVGICKSDYTAPSFKVIKDAGSVSVYSGITGASLVTGTPLTGTTVSQGFGCAVAAGYVSSNNPNANDDIADVIVGSPNADSPVVKDAGSVDIYLGNGL